MSTRNSDQLAYATAKSLRVLGKIRAQPEDFRVEEVPAYAPSGSGQHLFIEFEKTCLNTQQAVRQIAHALDVDPAQASFAGLKDRQAITTQWASVFGADAARARSLSLPGIRVLQAVAHPHKIRTGHLRGNRFVIRVECEAAVAGPAARELLHQLSVQGCPNFYGEQRFGREQQNLVRARRWLLEDGGAPRDRFERKLLVSTLQAEAFNRWLDARMRRIGLGRALRGDVMRKEDSGGLFVVEDIGEAQARMERWEISPTGPMFGTKLRAAEGEAGELEQAALSGLVPSVEVLRSLRGLAEGTRRPARVRPEAASVRNYERGIELAFALPKGAYATVVLRELLKPEESADLEPAAPDPP